jgi:hypothetical protein
MKYVLLPMPDIITIGKMVKVLDEDSDADAEGLQPGVYAFDSIGQCWQLKSDVTELFAMFDLKDGQLQKDRVEARTRFKDKLKKRRRKDA